MRGGVMRLLARPASSDVSSLIWYAATRQLCHAQCGVCAHYDSTNAKHLSNAAHCLCSPTNVVCRVVPAFQVLSGLVTRRSPPLILTSVVLDVRVRVPSCAVWAGHIHSPSKTQSVVSLFLQLMICSVLCCPAPAPAGAVRAGHTQPPLGLVCCRAAGWREPAGGGGPAAGVQQEGPAVGARCGTLAADKAAVDSCRYCEFVIHSQSLLISHNSSRRGWLWAPGAARLATGFSQRI